MEIGEILVKHNIDFTQTCHSDDKEGGGYHDNDDDDVQLLETITQLPRPNFMDFFKAIDVTLVSGPREVGLYVGG